jgi:hypothetical protein
MDRYHLLSDTGKGKGCCRKYENQIRNKLQLLGNRMCSGENFTNQKLEKLI